MTKRKNAKLLPPLTDETIESGADLSAYLQNPRTVSGGLEAQKVNVDFPAWVVTALDHEATRRGVPRQSLIKMWIVDRLESEDSPPEIVNRVFEMMFKRTARGENAYLKG